MNAKFIIIALCAAQVAAADQPDFSTYFQSLFSTIPEQISSIQQQFEKRISDLVSTAKFAVQSLVQQFQNRLANITESLSNSDAAPKVKACIDDGQQKATAVANSTNTQIETQAANQSQAAQPYINQTKAVGEQALDIAKQIGANYTACTKGNFLLYFTCLPTAISKAISTASSFGSSLNDIFTATLAAISQTGSSLASGFEANIKAATEQFKTIGEDLEKCIQDAANSTSPVLAPPSS